MKIKIYLGFFVFCALVGVSQGAPPEKWSYWPEYQKTPLSEIRAQEWREVEDVIDGWDWSLPPTVKPAANGLLVNMRTFDPNQSLNKKLKPVDLPINPTVSLWVNWKELELEEGAYRFDILQDRLAEAKANGYFVVLRILASSTHFAPEWMKDYYIPLKENEKTGGIENYDISHPEFHKRYLLLINALGDSGLPDSETLKGAYFGYASHAYGDEGIGPYGVDPDTVPHVVERLNAWAQAFKGVEYKVYMGGISQLGLSMGFGIRRGFVEMYLYHIPDDEIGQQVDENGYLWVDESNGIVRSNAFHGEENEEYDEVWATEKRGFRFGQNTDSYAYRYFTSNLRLLQMRCNYVLYSPFSILPEQMVWVGQSLGRTVEDSPDIWCAMRESYVRRVGPVKNFERWLYQRDSEGFETEPVVKVEQPIKMWMVEPGKYYDYIARRGKQIGLAIDDRWCGGEPVDVAIKVTYFDVGQDMADVWLRTKNGVKYKAFKLSGTNKLKTATFFVEDAIFPAKGMKHDIILKSRNSDVVVSFVRVIRL